jgi:hypothetical protein
VSSKNGIFTLYIADLVNSPAIPTGQLRVRPPLSSIPGVVNNAMPSAWDNQSPSSSEDESIEESMEVHDQKLPLKERFGLNNQNWQDFRVPPI